MPKTTTESRLFRKTGIESPDLPNFELKFNFLERLKKPLTLRSTRAKRKKQGTKKMADPDSQNKTLQQGEAYANTIVTYNEEELEAFKQDMEAKNTKKSTATAVRRLCSWYEEKFQKQLDPDKISKEEAPELLKYFFLEIRKTKKGFKGEEYEPSSLQTYRNGLRRYFLERPCPPAPDNFDIEPKKSGVAENFEEVAHMLSLKKKDLKKKGMGNKPNAAQSLEDEDIEKLWQSKALGLENSRALLNLVWWNNVTHLGMRATQEHHDCQLDDFTVTDQYIEYTERQTKNRQGNESSAAKRARKYNNKIWKTDGGERDPYRAFVEYVGHRPKEGDVSTSFYLSPVDNPTSNIWFKTTPVGRNTLAKLMKKIAESASLEGKITNSTGRKTVIQRLRGKFDPLEISELTGHADPGSISSYSHNPKAQQRRMSNMLAGFNTPSSSTSTSTSATSTSTHISAALREVTNLQTSQSRVSQGSSISVSAASGGSNSNFSGFLSEAVGGLFTGATFNNSPVNVNINLNSSVSHL